MSKPRIEQVVVVEGKADTQNLKRYFDVETIETNGSAVPAATLALIEKAAATHGVIVLTDPDFPGEQIRKKITAAVPNAAHAFITQAEGTPDRKGSLGIEHADRSALTAALRAHYVAQADAPDAVARIPKGELRRLGLLDAPQSRQLREELGAHLRIGYTNGKQLQKRLALFNLTLADVEDAVAALAQQKGRRSDD